MSVRQVYVMLLLGLMLCSICGSSGADIPPMPGLPHAFWGAAMYSSGENVEDGALVTAVVDGENYSTTVIDGMYGYMNPFHVEDPDNDNQGLMIEFFIDDVSTGQQVEFESGTTRLNLTVEKSSGSDDDDSGSGGDSSDNGGGMPPLLLSPVAVISAEKVAFVNVSSLFDASESSDADGQIQSYSWNFGDGTHGSGVEVSHVFNETGTFTVSLMVTDSDGLIDTAEHTLEVMIDTDSDQWGDDEESEYGTDPENSSDFPLDSDGDRIPDEIDMDDDNDGLVDTAEIDFGSDPLDAGDVVVIRVDDVDGFLVDTTGDYVFDIFVDVALESNVSISLNDTGWYELDLKGGDGIDFLFNAETGELITIDDSNNFLPIVIVIVLLLIGGIVVLWRRFTINSKSGEEKEWRKE